VSFVPALLRIDCAKHCKLTPVAATYSGVGSCIDCGSPAGPEILHWQSGSCGSLALRYLPGVSLIRKGAV